MFASMRLESLSQQSAQSPFVWGKHIEFSSPDLMMNHYFYARYDSLKNNFDESSVCSKMIYRTNTLPRNGKRNNCVKVFYYIF